MALRFIMPISRGEDSVSMLLNAYTTSKLPDHSLTAGAVRQCLEVVQLVAGAVQLHSEQDVVWMQHSDV